MQICRFCQVEETDGKDLNETKKLVINNIKVKPASKEESDKNEETANINKEDKKYTPRKTFEDNLMIQVLTVVSMTNF